MPIERRSSHDERGGFAEPPLDSFTTGACLIVADPGSGAAEDTRDESGDLGACAEKKTGARLDPSQSTRRCRPTIAASQRRICQAASQPKRTWLSRSVAGRTRPFAHVLNPGRDGLDDHHTGIGRGRRLARFLTWKREADSGASHGALAEFLPYAAKLTLECIGNSDALYHNIEHSMLVTLVGHDILVGRALQRATTAGDYANFIMACLTHDIGYVRGIVHGDQDADFVADVTGRTVRLPTGASDAALAPYHASTVRNCSLPSVFDGIEGLDAARIARAIEYTRFPYLPSQTEELDDLHEEEGLLLRAADLIGQLGDPNYMRKANALFYEFEEIGLNTSLGYNTPADVIYKYPQFYWKHVAPQVQSAIRYLNVTSSGRQWIANLYKQRVSAEREVVLSGPQMSSPR